MTARCADMGAGSLGVGEPWQVVTLDTVGSTMEEARRLAGEGAADRTVVRARVQTGGRGRHARPWVSPAGNVYMTAILRPAVPTSRAAEASLVAGVAMADTVARFAGPVRLKWPNDTLLGDAKVAGVALEAVSEGAHLAAVLIGIGINVASCPDLPDRPTARITTADADAVFTALIEALDGRCRQWLGDDGFDGIRRAWLVRGPQAGTPVTVRQGESRLAGAFDGLDPDGALRMRLADGRLHRVTSGEVLA